MAWVLGKVERANAQRPYAATPATAVCWLAAQQLPPLPQTFRPEPKTVKDRRINGETAVDRVVGRGKLPGPPQGRQIRPRRAAWVPGGWLGTLSRPAPFTAVCWLAGLCRNYVLITGCWGPGVNSVIFRRFWFRPESLAWGRLLAGWEKLSGQTPNGRMQQPRETAVAGWLVAAQQTPQGRPVGPNPPQAGRLGSWGMVGNKKTPGVAGGLFVLSHMRFNSQDNLNSYWVPKNLFVLAAHFFACVSASILLFAHVFVMKSDCVPLS